MPFPLFFFIPALKPFRKLWLGSLQDDTEKLCNLERKKRRRGEEEHRQGREDKGGRTRRAAAEEVQVKEDDSWHCSVSGGHESSEQRDRTEVDQQVCFTDVFAGTLGGHEERK